ncbi:cell envelope integrity protein TolA [Piscinibacter sp. XHJ-5]|uniref:cell envelope integrity protein TolA n=1 Tax=Piscinibacter sp. XHJ-5 TaxID=3037797 RepID=UPI002452CB06|nr:cell envelope integrity protein TolA [Piscinibacter sp. XHJ-5]
MNTAAVPRDDLMPREPRGMGPGLVLALLVHAVLIIAIAFSVAWRASEPEGVEAELWASVPQIAAPPAVTPEPQPVVKPEPPPPRPVPKEEPQPDAQIAIEKAKREDERKKKEEADKLAEKRKQEEADKLAEKRKQEQEDKRKKQLEEQKLAALREQNLKRMMGQAGATGDPTSTGKAERSAGPSAGYAGRIKARIKPNIVFPDEPAGNPLAEVELRLAPDGTIVSQKLVTSSGLKEWDDAVQRAIERTQVLPRDVDGTVPSRMVIAFRPRDL